MPLIRIEEDNDFNDFLCPICHTFMKEPVVASDGHTYEREAIKKWLKRSNKSPKGGLLVDKSLKPAPHQFKSVFELLFSPFASH